MSFYIGTGKLGPSLISLCHFDTGSLGTSSCLVMGGRHLQTTSGWGSWATTQMGDLKIRYIIICKCFFNEFLLLSIPNPVVFFLATKKSPKLKSRYMGHVQATIEYTKTNEDFDDLVDPWT